MPENTANANRPEQRPRGLSGSLIGMALLVFIGLYVLRDFRGEIGRWKMATAEHLHNQHQVERALAAARDAQRWDPDNIQFARKQVAWLRENNDLFGALETLNTLLASVQGDDRQTSTVLIMRADLLQAMGSHEEALVDSEKAFELLNVARTPNAGGPYNPSAVNTRAYFIARARAARQANDKQVGQALVEMQELIQFWDVNLNSLSSGSASPASKMEFRIAELMFLDTYAYLRLQARDLQGALYDLNRCVAMTDHLLALAESESSRLGQYAVMQEYAAQLREHKAVIIAHRGAAYRALGNPAAADADDEIARELGFSPQVGRW